MFFVIVLANLAVLLWEYRAGAFAKADSVVIGGQETILLMGEKKKG
ncbi:MAG: hypothetical protein PHU14_05155 [Methylovulum sp.]|nr:hypothetical protein [Methylovulum sp.]